MMKQAFCKHEFKAVNFYQTITRIYGHAVDSEDKVLLYCPKCDAEKVEREDDYTLQLNADIRKVEAKIEYLKSIGEYDENDQNY